MDNIKDFDWDRLYRVAKIFSKVEFVDDCWVYPAANGNRGQMRDKDGAPKYVTHIMWENWYGKPAVGILRHLCANNLCVNPAHLDDSTHSENMRDKAYPPVMNMIRRLEELGYIVNKT